MKVKEINLAGQNIINLKAVAVAPATDLIDNFSISADSVVATAEVKVKNGVTLFRLDWGDGHVSRINLKSSVVVHYGSTTVLEDGTYSLQHAYDVSDDGLQFQKVAMVTAQGPNNRSENRILSVAIRPKYQVWFSDVMIRLVDNADISSFEIDTVWEIVQHRTRILHIPQSTYEDIGEPLKWNFKLSQGSLPSAWHRLEGSRKSHNIFKNESMYSSFHLVENDFYFDDVYDVIINLYGGLVYDDEAQFREGPLEIRYAQTMTLINRLRDFTPPLSL